MVYVQGLFPINYCVAVAILINSCIIILCFGLIYYKIYNQYAIGDNYYIEISELLNANN